MKRLKAMWLLTCAVAVLCTCVAQAKNYETVWTQDFEDANTYTNEAVYGAVASTLLGTTAVAPSALTDAWVVYNESHSYSSPDKSSDHFVSWESRNNVRTGDSSHYLSSCMGKQKSGETVARLMLVLPEEATSVKDYSVAFDYNLSTSYSNNSNSQSNGLVVVGSSGNILATFVTKTGGSSVGTNGYLFRGDSNASEDILASAIPTGSRGARDTEGYWLHVTITGNQDDGVWISFTSENGKKTLASTQLTETFDTVSQLFIYHYAKMYVHYGVIDDIVVQKAVGAKTFVWTGDAGDSKWTTPGNWTVGGVVQTEFYPGETDTAEVKIANQTIIVEPGQKFGTLTLESDTKFLVNFANSGETFDVPDGIAAENVIAYKPFTMELSGTTYTATRNVSTFTWNVSSGDWSNPSNWTIDGTPTFMTPLSTDSASFNSAATVTLTEEAKISTLTIADSVRVAFASDETGTLRNLQALEYVCGESSTLALSFVNLSPLAGGDAGKTLTIGGYVEIVDNTTNGIYATSWRVDSSNKPTSSLELTGNLIGGGALKVGANNSQSRGYFHFKGDNSAFAGVVLGTHYSTDAVQWSSENAGSASAIWNLSQYDAKSLKITSAAGTTNKFGRLISNGVTVENTNGSILEIGALGGESTLDLASGTFDVIKVGAGNLTIDGNQTGSLTIESGTVTMGSADAALVSQNRAITFAGGVLVNAYGTDVSPYIANSAETTADIVIDDQGTDATWATLLPAAVKGGLTKKGAGTLSLVHGTALNGALRIEDGGKMGIIGGFTGEAGALLSWKKDASAREITLNDFADKAVSPVRVAIETNDTTIALMLYRDSNRYVYVGPDFGDWSDAQNWKVDEETATVAPSSGDAVSIGDGKRVIVEPGQTVGEVALEDGAKLAVRVTEDGQAFTQLTTVTTPLTTDDVVALGPFALTLKDGVFTAKRVASVFVWVGADGDWAEIANWKVKGLPTTVLPGTNDTAEFPKALKSVAVTFAEADRYVSNIVANADLTLSGTTYLKANVIYGSGLITLNGAKVMCNTVNLDISNDVCVATGTDNELRTSANRESTYYRINLLGKLSGDGNITANHGGKQGGGVAFYGDNHAFGGTFETTNFNQRDATHMDSYISSSSNAVWKVGVLSNNSTKDIFPSTDNAYKYFGAYIGNTWVSHGTKMEIGHRDDVESTLYAYSHMNYSGNMVRKVGSNVLNLRYGTAYNAVTKVDALYLEDGTVCLDYDLIPKVITFEEGGVLTYAAIPNDPSSVISNSTAAIAFDDQGSNCTWTAVIADSNTGGFTKKGTGTLTLTAKPEYTGITTVEAGKLVVPSGTKLTIDAMSNGTIEGASGSTYVYREGTTITDLKPASESPEVKYWAGTIDLENLIVDASLTELIARTVYPIVSGESFINLGKAKENLILPEGAGSWSLAIQNYNGHSTLVLTSLRGLKIGIRKK